MAKPLLSAAVIGAGHDGRHRLGKGQVEELLALSDAEQETLLKRLTHHALCKMRCLTWRGTYVRKGGSVPGGYEPYDFALDAIQQLLDGSRTWNREKYSTLEAVLRSFIDSTISKAVNLVENKRERRMTPAKGEATFDLEGDQPTPIQIVVDRDWQQCFHDAAMAELNGDKFLIDLFECLEADITAPSEIAQMLDIAVDDVNNGKKRLQRRLEKLDKQFALPKRRAKS